MLNDKFENLTKEDTYGLMLLLLHVSSDNVRYSALNELAYILDYESFLNFIKYYEGQTIQVPTMEGIQTSLKTLLLFQYYNIDHLEWHEALNKAGFLMEETHSAKRRLKLFTKYIQEHDYKLGGIINDYNR